MNGYDLTRNWYNFKFENPDKCRHIHSDLYFYIVDLWNRFGQKEKFGLPSSMTMEALGIKSRPSYYLAIKDLIDWGFIRQISASKNQNTSRIISICACKKNKQANIQALDQANVQAIAQADVHIDKQLNKETKEQKNNHSFDEFWDLYGKKVDSKKCRDKWDKLSDDVREKILAHVPKYVASTPDSQYRKNPQTYLNNECWNDEVQETKSQPDVKILTRKDFYDEPAYQRYCSKNNITPEP